MADVKISDLPSLGVNALTGLEAFIVQEGNTNSRVLLDTLGAYLAGSIVGYSAVITLNGGANNGLVNNYIDLFSPRIGNRIYKTFIDAAGLLPSNGTTYISVVLTDGTPANDIVIAAATSTEELNIGLTAFDIDTATVATGFSVKALVTGATVTAGTIKVITNYLP
jgi:hypothetical protein